MRKEKKWDRPSTRKVRDPNVAPMLKRKSGVMKPRNEPRGGARNLQKDIQTPEKGNPPTKPFYEGDDAERKEYEEYESEKYGWDDYDDYPGNNANDS